MFQILLNTPCRNLDTDGPAFGTFPQHVHHGLQVFFGIDFREFAGALYIFAWLFATQRGNLRRHLFSGQVPAHAGLCTLTDFDFNGISSFQVFIGHAVFVGNVLEYIFVRSCFFFRQDAAFSTAHGSLRQSGTFGQRNLGFFGQRTERHVGNIHRTVQHHGLLRMLPNHSPGLHRSVILQWRRIQLRAQQQDIVPAWHGHLCSHSPADGTTGHSHLMDLFHVSATLVYSGIGFVISQRCGRKLHSSGRFCFHCIGGCRYRTGNCIRFRFFSIRNLFKIGNRLLTDRAAGNLT